MLIDHAKQYQNGKHNIINVLGLKVDSYLRVQGILKSSALGLWLSLLLLQLLSP